jgi:endonuclease YncB( thermonuclease family)
MKMIRNLRAAFGLMALWLGSAAAADVHVTDGDTIVVSGITYRLEGIDAPEAGQPCNSRGGGTWACGKAATARMGELVQGQDVVCTRTGTDNYGRELGICRSGTVDLNRTMVTEGLAWAFTQYSKAYASEEDQARARRIGVWQAATETPWDYRARRWQSAAQQAPAGCPIKGNINDKGERIYHAPWSPWYERTRVNAAKGERWFCSEGEAIVAGWRAPMWGR